MRAYTKPGSRLRRAAAISMRRNLRRSSGPASAPATYPAPGIPPSRGSAATSELAALPRNPSMRAADGADGIAVSHRPSESIAPGAGSVRKVPGAAWAIPEARIRARPFGRSARVYVPTFNGRVHFERLPSPAVGRRLAWLPSHMARHDGLVATLRADFEPVACIVTRHQGEDACLS
jgi:hypothetical protein